MGAGRRCAGLAQGIIVLRVERDVLAVPVHGLNERNAVQGLLDVMQVQGWRSGQALPELPPSTENGDEL